MLLQNIANTKMINEIRYFYFTHKSSKSSLHFTVTACSVQTSYFTSAGNSYCIKQDRSIRLLSWSFLTYTMRANQKDSFFIDWLAKIPNSPLYIYWIRTSETGILDIYSFSNSCAHHICRISEMGGGGSLGWECTPWLTVVNNIYHVFKCC